MVRRWDLLRGQFGDCAIVQGEDQVTADGLGPRGAPVVGVEGLRVRLSPAIPRLPLGGEPLGLGDLCRGHLIGDAVSREPRPAAVR